MATSTTLAINKTLYPKLPYDPITDFSPIALVAAVPFALVVNPSLPINSLDEFINYVKARPGELSYGSVGNGSPHHLGGAMLNSAAGLDIKHVPYKGSALAMQDVIGGHIPLMVIDLPPALPYIRDGELRALGVTTAARVGAAPEIPTLAEVGFAGFELVAWQGVVAPAGVPRLIVDQLAGEIAALTSAPETRTMLNALALEPLIGSTPDSFARFVKSEIDRWAPIEGVGCIAGMSCAPRASAQAEHADAGRRRYARPDRRRWTGGAQHTHHPDARRYWPMDSHDAQTIPCPRCGRSMKLVHTIPKLGGIPELLIFSCQTCGEVETREVVQAAYAQGSGIHGEPRATP
jgi:tripartite-type tricarboxylate transporter receptor subunit TctC